MTVRTLTALALVGLVPTAFAQNLAGTWNGSMKLEFSPEVQKQMKGQQIPPMPKLTLAMRPNGTYTVTQVVPAMGQSPARTMKSDGTWSQKGRTVTMTTKTRDGKPVTGEEAKPRAFTLSGDGRTMTIDLSREVSKASPEAKGTKLIVTFRRA